MAVKSPYHAHQGYLILPKNLKIGHYRIEEVHAPEGYTINKNYVEIFTFLSAIRTPLLYLYAYK